MASLLSQVRGHEELLFRLGAAIQSEAWPSQTIFYGPEGIGKKRVALGIVQALFCEKKAKELTACGSCGSCYRVAQGTSENLLLVQPEKNLIKIEQSHQVLDFLSLQAWGSGSQKASPRAIIIDDAHCLNPQAANALLKIFEEPPEQCYFFLISHRHRLLLPTLRSRAKMVSFAALSVASLKELCPQAEMWKLLSARGSLKKLKELDQPGDVRFAAAEVLVNLLNHPDEFAIGDWRDSIKDREVASQYLNWWLIFLRDASLLVSDSQLQGAICSPDQTALLDCLCRFDLEKLQQLFIMVMKAERGLWAYQDPVLVFENLFITGFYLTSPKGGELYVD